MPLSRQRPATPRGIRADGCTFDCVLVDETDEIACAASGADAPPQAAGIDQRLERDAAVRGLLVFGRPVFRLLAQAPRDRASHHGFVVAAADETFVHFDGAFAAAAGPQLVEDWKGGFVTGKAELPLKLQRGLAGGVWVVTRCAPQNQVESGGGVAGITVLAVNEALTLQRRQRRPADE